MDEITSHANKVDVSDVVNLFENIRLEDVDRPVGHIDLLLVVNYSHIRWLRLATYNS